MEKHTILWADDDLDDLSLIKEILEELEHDHNLVEVSNGQEVLDYLHAIEAPSSFPCLVVLDVNMPVVDGRTTLQQIKNDKKLKDLPVAMFTTSYSEKDLEFYESFGALVFKKPPSYEGLKKVIMEVTSYC